MGEVFQSAFNENRSVSETQSLDWTVRSLANGSILLTLDETCKECNLHVTLEDGAQATIFVLNHAKMACDLNVNIECQANSMCKMGLLDMEESALQWKQLVVLKEEGAEFEILSGQLCAPKQDKIGDIEVRHEAAHTYGQIQNFAVLSDEGQYEMKANGNIRKGCQQAQSHQKTRVLTLGRNHKARVTPLLLIDENDVKASHALSIGQPDEDQLYYLCSRGLSKSQALGLLSIGYFLPVIHMLQDESLQQSLQEEMERKVGLYGHK